ncbi:MAG: Mrp/NBP35 family ATP-binding protein, partial [Alphaproteobacteria bacterium]|nr:Mrp/NBP35 family ATP-binding protein [Alphaproteobacteria bacterium]
PRRAARIAPDPRANPGAGEAAPRLDGVRRAVAVASGKGGVGKSTVAVNLACAFARLGLATGLVDADIYGPSAPRMLGVSEAPAFVGGKLEPVRVHGIEVMSIGLLVAEDAAMIWRGPMASQALRQMLQEVRWGGEAGLDMLVIDLPPGTGDVHLTLAQKLALDGVIIVSTPSEVALADARRAHAMFGKLNPPVPVLGVIENMAYFADPATGAAIPIFGHGEARAEAARLGAPFLGEIPIDMAVRRGGDEGAPVTAVDPDSDAARRFTDIARALL